FEDWYPADITPPAGTQYPCALEPLPRELPGIPAADRRFINHAYSLILRATQAKLVALREVERGAGAAAAVATYEGAVRTLRERLQAEDVPSGLEAFKSDVVAALDLQRAFFARAQALRERGGRMADAYALPEGHEASRRLVAAWGRMQARYPAWPEKT